MHDSGFFGRMELLGTGPMYHDAANTLREDGYELVNTRVGYADETMKSPCGARTSSTRNTTRCNTP
jgi:hypothetical protein